MNIAWISGRAGRAVVETASETFLILDGEDGPPIVCSPRQLSVHLSSYADVSRVNAGPFPFSFAREGLHKAVAVDRSHLYVLGLLDAELDDQLRGDLTADLEFLLADDFVHDGVLAMIRSAPLPAETHLHQAIELAKECSALRTVFLLANLDTDGPLIDRAHMAWSGFSAAWFTTDTAAAIAKEWFTRSGGFHQLVESMRTDSIAPFSTWMVRVARLAPQEFGSVPLKAFQRVQSLAGLSPTFAKAPLEKTVRDDPDERVSRRRRDRRPTRRLKGSEVLSRISAQIDEVTRRLIEGDEAKADQFQDDLITFQKRHNGTLEQIAKSLSNIAARARAIGRLDFAERSLQQALVLRPDDGWARSQLSIVLRDMGRLADAHEAARLGVAFRPDAGGINTVAEVLKAQGRYDEALERYEESIERFPDNVIALTGRAEVLKAQERYVEAFKCYERIIDRFPDNIFARNGRAEVLKAQGRYAEALDSYEEVVERFPENVVARNGRAEVLKAQGRYAEALDSYESIIECFPNDIVARNGRAEALKSQGRYVEALDSYEAVLERFPDDVYARNGHAEVLKIQGRYVEALNSYAGILERFPDDVYARTGMAEVLKAQGRYTEALRSYDEVIERFPYNVVARNGRTEVLKAQGRYDEALLSYEEIIKHFPYDVAARSGRAEVLKAKGHYAEALSSYDEVIARFPYNVVARNGRTEVLKAQGLYAEALKAYDAVIEHFPDDVFARNGRACVLMLLGRLEDAIQSLPSGQPTYPQDWMAFHIRGMAHVRQGALDEALIVFRHGTDHAPSRPIQNYFRTALAATQIRRGQFRDVIADLAPKVAPMAAEQRTTATVLLAHAFGAMSETGKAEAWLNETAETSVPLVIDLRKALAERYSLRLGARVPSRNRSSSQLEGFVVEREFQLLAISQAAYTRPLSVVRGTFD